MYHFPSLDYVPFIYNLTAHIKCLIYIHNCHMPNGRVPHYIKFCEGKDFVIFFFTLPTALCVMPGILKVINCYLFSELMKANNQARKRE